MKQDNDRPGDDYTGIIDDSIDSLNQQEDYSGIEIRKQRSAKAVAPKWSGYTISLGVITALNLVVFSYYSYEIVPSQTFAEADQEVQQRSPEGMALLAPLQSMSRKSSGQLKTTNISRNAFNAGWEKLNQKLKTMADERSFTIEPGELNVNGAGGVAIVGEVKTASE